jgi:hypothetical protein
MSAVKEAGERAKVYKMEMVGKSSCPKCGETMHRNYNKNLSIVQQVQIQ